MSLGELAQFTDNPDKALAILEGIAAAPEVPTERWLALTGYPPGHPAVPLMAAHVETRRRALQFTTDRSRVHTLRKELARRNLDCFIIPRADEHQGEYVPLRAERLQWISGFTGSAGFAIVAQNSAHIFVDGRYTIQVRDQVDTSTWSIESLYDTPASSWIRQNLHSGQRFGYDPRLHTLQNRRALHQACESIGAELVACATNPLDAVWADQPPAPLSVVREQPLEYSGKSADEKRHELGDALRELGVDAAILTAPDSIAWLLNIRGGDVPRTPLPLAFAALHSDGTVDLFLDTRKLTDDAIGALGEEVRIHAVSELSEVLHDMGTQELHVRLCPKTCADWFRTELEAAGATIKEGPDPCIRPKACKNKVELDGSRAAHVRDGVALTRFLCWLDQHAPSGRIDELIAEAKLHEFRSAHSELEDLSFDTISGAGSNGAIVHYRVSEQSNQTLLPGSLYLVDSGGQYRDGTTDVTRTVAIGTPTQEMRDRFTRVLLGHIRLTCAKFPKTTCGAQLDVLARSALWDAGLDYDHGTGHGVGSYLAVHEGPQNVSRRMVDVPLLPGMILSNEPGYYKTGEYGIRIENLIVVSECPEVPGGERPMLSFETLTLAPIDRRLIVAEMLSATELSWLNAYHKRVRDVLTPLVDDTTAAWLQTATAALS